VLSQSSLAPWQAHPFGRMPDGDEWSSARLRSVLAREPWASATLSAEDRRPGQGGQGTLRPAAVLIALLLQPGSPPGILLTKRTAHLRAHAGQIAFPGGRIEPSDASPEAAALREAEEEVGLPAASVELVGRLPSHVTGTGFRIEPVVGVVECGVRLRPDPGEVEEAFELPAAALWATPGPNRQALRWAGAIRTSWVVPHERHLIWGATATILVGLARSLGLR